MPQTDIKLTYTTRSQIISIESFMALGQICWKFRAVPCEIETRPLAHIGFPLSFPIWQVVRMGGKSYPARIF